MTQNRDIIERRISIIRLAQHILSISSVVLLTISNLLASEESYRQLTTEGIELAYNLHFDKAAEVFDELIKLEPNNPHGYLLQSVNFYYRYQLEEEHEEFAKKFIKFSTDAIETSKKKLSDKANKLDALFYLGTANMYLAAYHGWESNWLRAYWYGKEGIEYLEKVVEIDPEYYDAYLGLGLYHYYTDVIPTFAKAVTFILGIESDKERGLAELELAAERGTYSKAEALLFLGSIYLYIEKDYQKSLTYFEALSNLYPDNASFLMLLGENYQKIGQNELALRALNRLVNEETAPKFPVLIISSYFRLGNLYYNLRDIPKAIENYQKSLQYASQSTGNVKWVFALANLNLGRSYDLLGRRQQALEHYKKVKKSDHKHAHKTARKRMQKPLVSSDSYSKSKNYDEIMDIYQDALAKAKDGNGSTSRRRLVELKYQIAKAFYEKGAYQVAIPKFEKILAMQDIGDEWIKPWTHFYLGNCYAKTGEVQKARESYEIAYQFDDSKLRHEIDKIRETLGTNGAEN